MTSVRGDPSFGPDFQGCIIRLPTCNDYWQFSRWRFQMFFIFTPTWGNDTIWLIFFKWVETTTYFTNSRHINIPFCDNSSGIPVIGSPPVKPSATSRLLQCGVSFYEIQVWHGRSQHLDWFRNDVKKLIRVLYIHIVELYIYKYIIYTFTFYTYLYFLYIYMLYTHHQSQHKYIAQPCTACESYFLCGVYMNQWINTWELCHLLFQSW